MANSFYGTGRRKTSVARVTLTEGTGKFTFNGKDVEQYFPSPSMKMTIEKPFKVVNLDSKFNANAYRTIKMNLIHLLDFKIREI